ncbi:hypothetical protein B0T14DRAFT_565081 [Immersiella caudata]|uniref:G domain-containing protein n=1 Tax=Immersiella caudata TaxID=314043 RepID=A0AA39WYN0_9PEZI|nr:hypothetical protein B0T14DRAFT_565081 [Immersiella caudata]
MGMTGAGKSTFISRLKTSGNPIQIGHGLESKTADVAVYEARSPKNPRQRVLLADTPGFNDTVRSDTDVLRNIVTPLYELQKNGHHVLGVIYLQNIMNSRLAGTALKMLKVLQQFCGKENYGRIVFGTTMWEDAGYTPQGKLAACRRQEQLEREFWNDMFVGHGGVVEHVRDNRDSAGHVLNHFFEEFGRLKRPDRERPLLVFEEMINGKSLEQTGAYRSVYEEQRELRHRKERHLADLEEQLRQLDRSSNPLAYGFSHEVSNRLGQPSEKKQPEKGLRGSRFSMSKLWGKIRSSSPNRARDREADTGAITQPGTKTWMGSRLNLGGR